MAVVYTNAVKVARMAAVVAQAGITAVLEIGTTGMATVLATIPLGNPIAGAATGAGVLTMSGFPRTDSSADASGVAAAARVRTSTGGTDIISGLTAGTSGTDLVMPNTTLVAGEPFTITSFTLTHAA
ncbi:MAG: hypothetical protein HEQ39_10005 [Rhizobacter sp.]